MKVSLFVHELSGNGIVRAYPIAKAIEHLGHQVEVLGLTYNTDKIYEPYNNAFEYKPVRSYLDIRWVILNGRKVAKLAEGDIAYSFKGIWDSYWPALLYSGFSFKKPLIMDAEDNELWDAFIGNGWKDILKNPYYPVNPVYNKLLHPFTFLARNKTVVCSSLQKRYGGKIVLHGPDANIFDPVRFDSVANLRKKYGIPQYARILLFAGKPVFYNGLPFLIDALQRAKASEWHLVLAGNPDNPLFLEAKKMLGARCHLLGFIPNENMPEVVKLADVVPIIQSLIPTTQMQIPAKLLEAMSMAKGIIGTRVCDIPLLLDDKRGWVIEPGDTDAFLNVLDTIDKNPELLYKFGEACRSYYIEHASVEAIAEKIKPLLDKRGN